MLNYDWRKLSFYIFLLVIIFFISSNSYAAPKEGELIRLITNKFESITGNWHKNLRPAILYLFFILATISFAYNAITMAIRGVDFPEIILELAKMILLIGLWLYIINNSIEIVNAIINSFTQSANLAAGVSSEISPGEIINGGIDIATEIISQSGFWNTPIYGIIALVALLAYLFIAATLFLVLVESYVVTGAGIILLGFAGSPWTSDISKKYLFFALSIGVKMFATIMVARFGEELVRDSLTATSSMEQIFAVTGVLCMIAYLTNRIPAMAQSMLSGASSSGPGDARGIAAVAGKATMAGLMAGAGTAAGLVQAGKGAWAEMKAGSGGATSALAAATSPSQGVMGGSSSLGSAGAGDNDKSAIPEAISARSASSSGASATPTPTPAAAGAMAAAEKEAGNADNPTAGANAAKTANPAGNSAEKQSRISAGVQAMKAYAAKADNAVKHAPELMRKTAKNYAKGSIAGTAESLAKPSSQRSPFDIARTISAQNISKKIDRESE